MTADRHTNADLTADRALSQLLETQRAITVQGDRLELLLSQRRELVETLLLKHGFNHSAIAHRLGISRARVTQILSSGTAGATTFLNPNKASKLTVVIGARSKSGKSPLYAAFEELAAATRLSFEYEQVGPGDELDLNRPNLLVACGPTASVAIHSVLQYDTTLTFKKEAPENRWYLVARPNTPDQVEYRSPIDVTSKENEEPIDFGYLGRRPTPDNQDTFLCLAGIHLEGTLGVLHYLRNNLAALQRKRKGWPFSTLIQANFDARSRIITSSVEVDVSPGVEVDV